MTKSSKRKIGGIIGILFIIIIAIIGEKIKTDNSNNLEEQIVNNSEIINAIENQDENTKVVSNENIYIYYFDVGQADSILI